MKCDTPQVQVRDLDLARRTLTVFGKGQKARVLPLRGRVILAAEEYLLETLRFVKRTPEPDDYLLYSEHCNGSGVHKADPKKPMPKSTVHRWWYEQLALAGITAKGVERGMNMHRARHTFATELRRDSKDLGIVQRMLGHDDIHTTEAYYGHYDMSDLEAAMEKFAKERGQ
jgi:integrase